MKVGLKYKRVLLKISGEMLGGGEGRGLDTEAFDRISEEIIKGRKLGAEMAVVVGGGNIVRGATLQKDGVDRATADYMGMLGTIINAIYLQSVIERKGYPSRVLSAISVPQVCEPYIRRRAIRHLEKGRIVIFAGGTGNPYFSTDTAASLRAFEISADVIVKATKVDGVYSDDPMKNQEAKKFDFLSYKDFINLELKVMDTTAITMCMENKIPIIVFNISEGIEKVLLGEKVGTLIG